MAGTIITPIATALATIADGLPNAKGFVWAPGGVSHRGPYLVVEPPAGDRTMPDEAESQLFANDWNMTFSCAWYIGIADKPQDSQQKLIDMLELWIVAIDADQSLSGTVLEAKVTQWEDAREVELIPNTQYLLRIKTTVSVLKLV